jgi:hypothetical protein
VLDKVANRETWKSDFGVLRNAQSAEYSAEKKRIIEAPPFLSSFLNILQSGRRSSVSYELCAYLKDCVAGNIILSELRPRSFFSYSQIATTLLY